MLLARILRLNREIIQLQTWFIIPLERAEKVDDDGLDLETMKNHTLVRN